MPGDEGYTEGNGQTEDKVSEVSEKVQLERAREQRFGEWWRARLVSEFEGDLGGLAAVSFENSPSFSLSESGLTYLALLGTWSHSIST